MTVWLFNTHFSGRSSLFLPVPVDYTLRKYIFYIDILLCLSNKNKLATFYLYINNCFSRYDGAIFNWIWLLSLAILFYISIKW